MFACAVDGIRSHAVAIYVGLLCAAARRCAGCATAVCTCVCVRVRVFVCVGMSCKLCAGEFAVACVLSRMCGRWFMGLL